MVSLTLMLAAALAGAAGPVSIPDIVEVADISGLATSPDGKLVAFRTEHAAIDRNGYELAWYVVPADGSAPPRKIADGGEALFEDSGVLATATPIWSPRSNAIYVRALIDGAVQVWRAPVDGSGATEVTQDPANVRDLAANPNGQGLVYHVGAPRAAIEAAERRSDDGGVLVDASVDMAQPMVRGAFVDGRLASQRFIGSWFDRGDILWQTPVITRSLDWDQRDAGEQGGFPASSSRPGSTGTIDPATVATIERVNGHPVVIAKLGDGRRVSCTAILCRTGNPVSVVTIPGDGRLLVTMSDLALHQTLLRWDPVRQQVERIAAVPGLLNGGREPEMPCAATRGELVCVEAEASAPPRLVRVDLAGHRQAIVFDPNAQLRATIRMSVHTRIWHDPSGSDHGAELVLPTGPKPAAGFPLLISYYHCPGFLRGGLGDELPLLPLASQGIAALCINRAANDPTHQDPAVDYDHAVSGISSIVETLAGEHLVDPSHVGMGGLSFGSEVVVQVALRTHLLSAVSIATGLLEPSTYWMHGVAGRDYAEELEKVFGLGPPDYDAAPWKKQSLALRIEDLDIPILLQMPEQEARTTMELMSRATRLGKPIESWVFAREPHIKNRPRHKLAVYDRNADWFRFWLQGKVDAAPDKWEQYRRWKGLAAGRHGTQSKDLAGP
ncbi:MAG TPA: Atxe2 family lasso peptide isopeptidase [Sphingomonas sp.]|nr:Atxe2 family lasso peptide isopeptidase [Sphingomonas sp.]